ncbi:MAG: hypothetical protein Q7K57_37910 [Burkholderiaceae bacterium]|nr:hypothetical protein [Burkholderiaceae bacterium]
MNLPSIVQMCYRQRAARAALALPVWQCCKHRLRLAWTRSRAGSRRLQGPARREGKIKGPARAGQQSQSARGLGAARRLAAGVPSQNANPQGIRVGRVPSLMRLAALRWSLCHGLA